MLREFALAQRRMNLAVANAVNGRFLLSAFTAWHQVVLVNACSCFKQPAAKRTRLGRRGLDVAQGLGAAQRPF